jgi:peptidoglycan/xylan/chitin deacetylase (PgdA/CDA1 family)
MNLSNIQRLLLKLSLLVLFSLLACVAKAQTETQTLTPPPAPAPKQIALTFDDGPYGAPTIEVLNILKVENIHATFFLIGQNVEKYPEILKEIVADGNVVGNHTYDHPKDLTKLSSTEFNSEVSKTENAIFAVTGLLPALFRAPYGNTSPEILQELGQDNYTLVKWNVDPRDWDYPNSPAGLIEKIILAQVKPNDVILLHDGRDTHIGYPRDNTIKALPEVIETLKKEGYTFVTVDKLLNMQAYK